MGFESFKPKGIMEENDVVLTKDGAVAVEKGAGTQFLIDKIDNSELKTKYGILRTHSGDLFNFKNGNLLTTEEAWKIITEISQTEK